MDPANLWLILIPPIAGGVIGYFTNDLAIQMLFRPYKPLFVGKWRVPFTPGLIPANQERLAQRVADTIMGSLLTPGELQRLTQRLLQKERVQEALLWFLRLALKQVQAEQEQKTAMILANILRDLFSGSLPRLLRALARQEDFLAEQINYIFDQVVLEFQLTDPQARQLADWVLQVMVPPDVLRQALIEFLTDRNIQIIDEGLREKTSGTTWVVANLFGVRNSLVRLRTFCLDEKEITNARLKELVLSLEVRDRLRFWLQELSLQNLPLSTVRQLRKTTRDTIRIYIQERGGDLLEQLSASVDWDSLAKILLKRLRDSEVLKTSLETVSWELALLLERYLEEELELLVAKILPILSLDQVIVERVMATTPAELESTVQGIVKSELQAIVNLGGILGLVIGGLQSVWLLLR
ncbi:DUF445 family protein [Spirulina sp. CCNP1310]|uniref:DUF445 domain-containing protein n=1 Tax=Spirulina sp. CCNP1310 TaxID=3110249 RepID=UPI002B217A01|nr:DUF445 family protein [Spirulina sp. CCNP1310]MEA5421174.1 DUF445 family protein [Spirulina sp. CCNP1310]